MSVLDNSAIITACSNALRDEFGFEPPAEALTAFVMDLLYGSRDLAAALDLGIVTPLEVANALLARAGDWFNAKTAAPRRPELWPEHARKLVEVLNPEARRHG